MFLCYIFVYVVITFSFRNVCFKTYKKLKFTQHKIKTVFLYSCINNERNVNELYFYQLLINYIN